tara:strand:- start:6333 stop:6659 length:327 start_codon:yes stop_codon:yes gene_type:complete
MIIKGTLFDELGNSYLADNVEIYVGEMKDRLLVVTYMNTIHFHEIELETMKALLKEGVIETIDEDYDSSLTLSAIASMREEIIERFDEDYHAHVIEQLKKKILKAKNS